MFNWLRKFLDRSMKNKAIFFIMYFCSVLLVCAQTLAVFPFSITGEYWDVVFLVRDLT